MPSSMVKWPEKKGGGGGEMTKSFEKQSEEYLIQIEIEDIYNDCIYPNSISLMGTKCKPLRTFCVLTKKSSGLNMGL